MVLGVESLGFRIEKGGWCSGDLRGRQGVVWGLGWAKAYGCGVEAVVFKV